MKLNLSPRMSRLFNALMALGAGLLFIVFLYRYHDSNKVELAPMPAPAPTATVGPVGFLPSSKPFATMQVMSDGSVQETYVMEAFSTGPCSGWLHTWGPAGWMFRWQGDVGASDIPIDQYDVIETLMHEIGGTPSPHEGLAVALYGGPEQPSCMQPYRLVAAFVGFDAVGFRIYPKWPELEAPNTLSGMPTNVGAPDNWILANKEGRFIDMESVVDGNRIIAATLSKTLALNKSGRVKVSGTRGDDGRLIVEKAVSLP